MLTSSVTFDDENRSSSCTTIIAVNANIFGYCQDLSLETHCIISVNSGIFSFVVWLSLDDFLLSFCEYRNVPIFGIF